MKSIIKKFHGLDLTTGNTIKTIWLLAFPIMMGNLLQTAFNVVDMIWVGRLGPGAIAAVGMSGVVLMVVITLIIGVSTGTQALISRFIGAKKQKEAENVAMQSLIIGLGMSIIMAAIGIFFSRPILKALGANSQILEAGSDYLNIILSGGFMMVYLFLITTIFRATGDTFTPMLIMLGAVALNIILDPLMIFGIGFPRMEVSGAALATVISRGTASLAGLYILFKGHSRVKVHFSKLKMDIRTIIRILKVGFPNCVQMALRSVVGLVLMSIVARYGHYAIAAYGIGLRVFSIVLMPGFALATSAATLVGQNMGAKNLSRAKRCAWQAAGFNILLMGLVGIMFYAFSSNLISVFNNNPNVVQLGSEYLRITSFSYIFVALGLVLGRSLMGAGDTISPMFITLIALLGIQIPLAYILSNNLHIGLNGIWWAILISSIIHGSLTTFWFKLDYWKLKKI
ncbi:MAG: MATE family efflux transporter [Candidatus Omnitrophica bacterium]|nr:MATE family efflux transporter [Candidatus Omnitrophota bacterium]